jgi:hypothetical protein
MLTLLLVELIHVKQTHHKEDLQIYQGKGIIVIGEDLYRPSLVSNHLMVSVLASSAVDHKIGICCFSAKQAALERKNTDWLARNQDNVSEWGDMSVYIFFWGLSIKV